jgi:hypothetical protein
MVIKIGQSIPFKHQGQELEGFYIGDCKHNTAYIDVVVPKINKIVEVHRALVHEDEE